MNDRTREWTEDGTLVQDGIVIAKILPSEYDESDFTPAAIREDDDGRIQLVRTDHTEFRPADEAKQMAEKALPPDDVVDRHILRERMRQGARRRIRGGWLNIGTESEEWVRPTRIASIRAKLPDRSPDDGVPPKPIAVVGFTAGGAHIEFDDAAERDMYIAEVMLAVDMLADRQAD